MDHRSSIHSKRMRMAVALLGAVLLAAGAAFFASRTQDEAQDAAELNRGSGGASARSGGVADSDPAPTSARTGAPRVDVPVEPPPRPANPASAPPLAAPAAAEPLRGPALAPGSSTDPADSSPNPAHLAKEDIRAAIRQLMPAIGECYQQGLRTSPDLEGVVKVEFVLARSPDGGSHAREGEVYDSTLKAPFVEACILSKIQVATFKELKGEGQLRVRYPFRFEPARGFGGGEPGSPPVAP